MRNYLPISCQCINYTEISAMLYYAWFCRSGHKYAHIQSGVSSTDIIKIRSGVVLMCSLFIIGEQIVQLIKICFVLTYCLVL